MLENQLKQRINDDMKTMMRANDKVRLGIIRMLMAAIKQREVDERIVLDDIQIIAVINKMIKQRQEACAQFQAGGRQDLTDKENFEIEFLKTYMPQALDDKELEQLIVSAINEINAKSMQDMGKVMEIVKTKAQGRADMTKVSAKVKTLLAAK